MVSQTQPDIPATGNDLFDVKNQYLSNAHQSLVQYILQVAGPIVFKVDSQFQVGAGRMEDLIYSLNYSLRLLESGKIVAWYSPKRKEGMIELRVFEF